MLENPSECLLGGHSPGDWADAKGPFTQQAPLRGRGAAPPSESSVTPTFLPEGVEVNFAAGSREIGGSYPALA